MPDKALPKYAAHTEVPIAQTKDEIERALKRYGAAQFVSGWDAEKANEMIGFKLEGRQYRFWVPIPNPADAMFTKDLDNPWRSRPEKLATALWEQACRQRWRTLGLGIKAKLAMVEAGCSTVELEFLANTVMADGSTMGQWAKPQIDQMYLNNKMPPLLLGEGPEAKKW